MGRLYYHFTNAKAFDGSIRALNLLRFSMVGAADAAHLDEKDGTFSLEYLLETLSRYSEIITRETGIDFSSLFCNEQDVVNL